MRPWNCPVFLNGNRLPGKILRNHFSRSATTFVFNLTAMHSHQSNSARDIRRDRKPSSANDRDAWICRWDDQRRGGRRCYTSLRRLQHFYARDVKESEATHPQIQLLGDTAKENSLNQWVRGFGQLWQLDQLTQPRIYLSPWSDGQRRWRRAEWGWTKIHRKRLGQKWPCWL